MKAVPAGPLVVITRDERGNDEIAAHLRRFGARVSPLPTIQILPPKDLRPLEQALGALGTFQWIVFTSAHAVETTCAHAVWLSTWRRLPGRPRVAAVGRATAARLAAHGVEADVVPREASAASLVAALTERRDGLAGARVLWPRSDIARRELPDALAAAGAVVCEPAAYRTVAAPARDVVAFVREVQAGRVAAVAFLSPSSAMGLASAMPGRTLAALCGRVAVASIGPTTSTALAALGAPADVEATERSAAGLAEAIARHLAARDGATR